MSKCGNCGVQIRDSVPICPLCKCIVEPTDGEESVQLYPSVLAEKGIKKMQLALNIYLFAAIAAEVILAGVDYAAGGRPGWVIMIAGFFVYGYITLKVSIQMNIGYQVKLLLQTLLGVAVLILIDVETGFHGWAANYVLPSAFVLLDLEIVILMIVNKRNWQSYIPLELLVIALSAASLVLCHFGIITHLTVPLIAMGVAVMTFVGTVIIGGQRARDELYRRFHV